MAKATTDEKTTDAVEILHRRFIRGKPEMDEALQEARLGSRIARRIYELRTEKGMTQEQLAAATGMKRTAISRLERGDTYGYNVSTLRADRGGPRPGARRRVPAAGSETATT